VTHGSDDLVGRVERLNHLLQHGVADKVDDGAVAAGKEESRVRVQAETSEMQGKVSTAFDVCLVCARVC
jgi:hypothetical protein